MEFVCSIGALQLLYIILIMTAKFLFVEKWNNLGGKKMVQQVYYLQHIYIK